MFYLGIYCFFVLVSSSLSVYDVFRIVLLYRVVDLIKSGLAILSGLYYKGHSFFQTKINQLAPTNSLTSILPTHSLPISLSFSRFFIKIFNSNPSSRTSPINFSLQLSSLFGADSYRSHSTRPPLSRVHVPFEMPSSPSSRSFAAEQRKF